MNKSDPYVGLANKIMEYFQKYGRSDTEDIDLGEVLLRITEMAIELRRHGNCRQAINCCEYGFSLLKEPWKIEGQILPDYANGVLLLCSASTHLRQVSQDKRCLQTAIEEFEQSAKSFHDVSQPSSEGIAWLSLGMIYSQLEQWDNALGALQRSLTAAKLLFDNQGAELRQVIRSRLDEVEEALRRDFREDPGIGVAPAGPDDRSPGSSSDHPGSNRGGPDRRPSQPNASSPSPSDVPRIIAFRRPSEELIHIPVVAKIAAGEPILAYEDSTGPITIDVNHANGATLALIVTGDSMIKAGILNGDYVLIRQQPTAENGEIVAAMISDFETEATLKRLYLRPNHVLLKPENDQEKWRILTEDQAAEDVEKLARKLKNDGVKYDILVGSQLDIIGRMVGLLRVFGKGERLSRV